MNVVVPKVLPVSPDTWELRVQLPRTDEETARVVFECPNPCTVVGAYCSVIQGSSIGGLLIPTLDDLLVLIDLDQQRRFTAGPKQGQTAQTSRSSSYATLAALDSRVRNLYWDLTSPSPVIGFVFRWRRFDTALPFYEDADIGVALFVIPGSVAPQT